MYVGNAAYSAVTSSSENEKESDQESFMGKLKSVVNDPRTQSTINIGKHGVNAISMFPFIIFFINAFMKISLKIEAILIYSYTHFIKLMYSMH